MQCSSFISSATCPLRCLWSGTTCREPAASCARTHADCVMVLYEYRGISEYIRAPDIVNSSNGLANILNFIMLNKYQSTVLSAMYDEGSITFSGDDPEL